MSALPKETEQIAVPGEVILFPGMKLKKDGTPKKTKNPRTSENGKCYLGGIVEPVREKSDVEKIGKYLIDIIESKETSLTCKRAAMRNLMIFTIGINSGLRINDLLDWKWKNVLNDDYSFKDAVEVKEQKTGKHKTVILTPSMKSVIKKYIDFFGKRAIDLDDPMFTSFRRRKDGRLAKVSDDAVGKFIANTAEAVGIKGNFYTHTLRKTYAYQRYIYLFNQYDNGKANGKAESMALERVSRLLNHSSVAVTVRYLGLAKEEDEMFALDTDIAVF